MAVGINNVKYRYSWIEKTLLKIPDGKSILDAGAGELKFKPYCKHLNYTSQDFGQYEGEKSSSKGLQHKDWDNSKLDIISDITSIPVEDESFDAVMCIEVLEHVPDPIVALKELTRVLKKGGYLIITAPFNSLTHFAPYHFSTGFSRYFYEHHLNELGYQIEEIKTNGNYFEYLAQETRRLPGIAKKYSGIFANKVQRMALKIVLSLLEKASEKDGGSDELLSFGLMVFARKK